MEERRQGGGKEQKLPYVRNGREQPINFQSPFGCGEECVTPRKTRKQLVVPPQVAPVITLGLPSFDDDFSSGIHRYDGSSIASRLRR